MRYKRYCVIGGVLYYRWYDIRDATRRQTMLMLDVLKDRQENSKLAFWVGVLAGFVVIACLLLILASGFGYAPFAANVIGGFFLAGLFVLVLAISVM